MPLGTRCLDALFRTLVFIIVATPTHGGSEEMTTFVSDELGFFTSLKNQSVTHILLKRDLRLRTEFWAQSWNRVNLTRNLTIEGGASDSSAYIQLDFSFISSKAVLSAGVVVTFRRLAVLNALSRIQLSYDFFDPSPTSSAIVWWDVINHLLLCMPLDFAVTAWNTVPRSTTSDNVTGIGTAVAIAAVGDKVAAEHQNVTLGTTPHCTAAGRCFSPVMYAWDILGAGERGYVVYERNVMVICDNYATQECIDKYGASECYATVLQKLFDDEQRQRSAGSSSGKSGSGNKTGAIVGSVVAGTVLVLVVTVFLVVRHRRRRDRRAQEQAAKMDKGLPHPSFLLDSDIEAVVHAQPSSSKASVPPDTQNDHHARGLAAVKLGGQQHVAVSPYEFACQSRDTVPSGGAALSTDQLVLTGTFPGAAGGRRVTALVGAAAAATNPAQHSQTRFYVSNTTSPFNTDALVYPAAGTSSVGAVLPGNNAATAGGDPAPGPPSPLHPALLPNGTSSTGGGGGFGALTTFGTALMSLFRSRSRTGIRGGSGPHSAATLSRAPTTTATAAATTSVSPDPVAATTGAAGGPFVSDRPARSGRNSLEDHCCAQANLRALTHTGSFKVIRHAGSGPAPVVPSNTSSARIANGGGGGSANGSGHGSLTGTIVGPSNITLGALTAHSSTPAGTAAAADGEVLLLKEVLMSAAANVQRAVAAGASTAGGGDGNEGGGGNGDCGEEGKAAACGRPMGMAVVVAGLAADAASAAQEVMLGPLIGSGSFGKVYRGTWRGSVVAVKVISHGRLNTQASIENELRLSMSFDHRNVVRAVSYITCSVDEDGVPTLTIQSRDAVRSRMSLRSGADRGGDVSTFGGGDSSFTCGTGGGGGMIGALYDNAGGGEGGDGGGGGAVRLGADGHALPRDVAETWVIQEFMGRGTLSAFLRQGGMLQRAVSLEHGYGPRRAPCGPANASSSLPSPSRLGSLQAGAGPGAVPGPHSGTGGTGATGVADFAKISTDASGGAPSEPCPPNRQRPALQEQEPLPGESSASANQQLPQPQQPQQPTPMVPAPVTSGVQPRGPLTHGPDMRRVVLCALDVARGLEYLHRRNVCHGDLKPGNILLADDPKSPWGLVAKLADFGLSRALAADKTHMTTNTFGTVAYMCPLVLGTGKVSPSSCVYSYGIILWELVSRRPPYYGCIPGQIVKGVMLDDLRPDFSPLVGVPDWYSDLARRCWSKQAAERPTMAQVVAELEARAAEPDLMLGSTTPAA